MKGIYTCLYNKVIYTYASTCVRCVVVVVCSVAHKCVCSVSVFCVFGVEIGVSHPIRTYIYIGDAQRVRVREAMLSTSRAKCAARMRPHSHSHMWPHHLRRQQTFYDCMYVYMTAVFTRINVRALALTLSPHMTEIITCMSLPPISDLDMMPAAWLWWGAILE